MMFNARTSYAPFDRGKKESGGGRVVETVSPTHKGFRRDAFEIKGGKVVEFLVLSKKGSFPFPKKTCLIFIRVVFLRVGRGEKTFMKF